MGLGDLFSEIGNAVKNEAGNIGNTITNDVSSVGKFLFPQAKTTAAPSSAAPSSTPQSSVETNRSRGEPATGAVGSPNQTGVPAPKTGVAGVAGTDVPTQGQGVAGNAAQDPGVNLNMPTSIPGQFGNNQRSAAPSPTPVAGDSGPQTTNNAGSGAEFMDKLAPAVNYNGLSSVAGNDPAYTGDGQAPQAQQPSFWDNLLGTAKMLGKGVAEILGNTGLIYMGQPSISQVKAGYRQQQLLQQRDIDNQQLLQKHSLDWDQHKTDLLNQLQKDLQANQIQFDKDNNQANRDLADKMSWRNYTVALQSADTQQMVEAQAILGSKNWMDLFSSRGKGQ